MDKSKKAALYIRVSTKPQEDEGYSPKEQADALYAYAEGKGYAVLPEHVYREGRSGRLGKKRPAFDEMMSGVREKLFDAVLVHSFSRFARSVEETTRSIRIMGEHGVEFVSLHEDFDTSTPMGQAMMAVISAFAQLYSDQLSMRIKEAYRNAEKRGGKLGPPPYGWRHNGNSVLVEDVYEQGVIELVRSLRADGLSIRGICGALEERGYKNRHGVVSWNVRVVHRLVSV